MRLHADGGEPAAEDAVRGLIVRDNADVGMVSLVAAAGGGKVADGDGFAVRHALHSLAVRTSTFGWTSDFGTSVGQ
jgi:hypothetical protein